ncbi:ABC transporter ATP-binding protein [Dokdonella sp.]|uniref:ABC transporter ATP-binding protein n=1 Tax=Dokdonella sp. TaxID=2291710 RepID=UPI002F40C351
MTAPVPTLALAHAGRRIAGRTIVRALDLELSRGEVLGLLGVNGAGKTTTLRMMAGVLAPTSGCVRLDGEDLHERPELGRRRIGYLPEVPPLHAELDAEEYLAFCARLHAVPRGAVASAVARAIERCGLGDVRRRPLGALSKGYRQRVGVAQAILHEPDLIVLDEPASGLDPIQALNLRELVRSLGRDHAVVLSTHVLPDVSACCDRVAILHHGELRHAGNVHASSTTSLRVGVSRVLREQEWRALPMVVAAESLDPAHWRVELAPGSAIDAFSAAVVAHGFGLTALAADAPPLESVFLAIAASDAPAAAA